MTTTVVKSLGDGSRNYSTIAGWIAGAPSDLTATRSNNLGTGSTTSTAVLDASASAVNSFYNGLVITVSGEARLITAYVGATKTATIGALNGSSATFSGAPANGTAYVIDSVVWKGEMYNDPANLFVVAGVFSISGQTTSSTCYMWLTAASGQSFADNANKLTNALRYSVSNGVGIESTSGFAADMFTLGSNYTQVDRLQFYSNYVSHNYGVVLSGTNCTIKNSICYRGSVYGSSTSMCRMNGANGTAVNVLLLTDSTNSDAGFAPETSSDVLINCTAIYSTGGSTRRAFDNQYGHPLVRNCAAFGFTDWGRTGVALDASSDYGATDIASPSNMPGTHNLTSLTASAQWTATGASYDARPKSGNSLAAGTRDQTYTSDLDIIGQARSTTTPTIGAFEYVVSGGTSVAITGVAGTGAVGTVVPNFSIALTGAAATAAVGTVVPGSGFTVALTGVTGTASVGSVASAFSIPLTGVTATGGTGAVTPTSGTIVPLTGVNATGAVGTLSPAFSIGLTGVQGTGAVGTLSPPSGDANSGGYNDMGGRLAFRRRTEEQLEEARERFGITRKAAIVIERVAEQQAETLELDSKARNAELRRELKLADLKYQARHLEMLNERREKLISAEIAARESVVLDDQDVLALLMLAAAATQ